MRKGREGGGADLRHAKSGSWGGSWAFRRTQARWKKDPEATLKNGLVCAIWGSRTPSLEALSRRFRARRQALQSSRAEGSGGQRRASKSWRGKPRFNS